MPSVQFYKLDFFASMLMVLNSAMNFIIYCSMSTPFKEAFVEQVCCPSLSRLRACFSPQAPPPTERAEVDLDDDLDEDEMPRNLEDNAIVLEEMKRDGSTSALDNLHTTRAEMEKGTLNFNSQII